MSDPDLSLATMLLIGYTESDPGNKNRLRTRYLEGAELLDARRAMARVLSRERPDRQLLATLARLFDPDPLVWEQREIKIGFRGGRGRPPDYVANTQIAQHVWDNTDFPHQTCHLPATPSSTGHSRW
jgi:hypothetical protein